MSPVSQRLQICAGYYPEHWQEAHWAEDIRLMRAAGLTVMRMGEFAWSSLEPSVEACLRVGADGREVFLLNA